MTTAIILNWNELHVVKPSIEVLLREGNVEVVVVDNGSRDGSAEYLAHMSKRAEYANRVRWALLDHNHGSSVARNIGIDMAKGEHIFLLDGDILYVQGTIPAYLEVMNRNYNAKWGCVGYNDHHRVQMTGMNGVEDPSEAMQTMPNEFTLSNWFPMAWTQYGLFDGKMLRTLRFHQEGCFGEFGHGYEDDWLYHDMQEHGYQSIAVNAPLYYHDGHYSLRLLKSMNLPDRGAERAELFYERWGRENGWRERMAHITPEERMPFASYTTTPK